MTLARSDGPEDQSQGSSLTSNAMLVYAESNKAARECGPQVTQVWGHTLLATQVDVRACFAKHAGVFRVANGRSEV